MRSSRSWTPSPSNPRSSGRAARSTARHIIEAEVTGNVFRLNGNIRNDGFITNLPNGCCVEVPIYVDRTGLHPTHIGALPPQLAALNMTNVMVQGLTRPGGVDGRPRARHAGRGPGSAHLRRADAQGDPVHDRGHAGSSSARGCPSSQGRKLRDVPIISVPKDVKRQSVPLDPALAIANRFGKLAEA